MPLRRDNATNVHTLAITVVSTSRTGRDDESEAEDGREIMSRSHQPISLALPLQRRRVDPERARGGFERRRLRHDAGDVLTLQRVERNRRADARDVRQLASSDSRTASRKSEFAGLEHVPRRQNDRALDGIAQLAKIAGPRCASIACSARGENVSPRRRCFRLKIDR